MKIQKLRTVFYEIGIIVWIIVGTSVILFGSSWYAEYKYPDLPKTIVELHLDQAEISPDFGVRGSTLSALFITSGDQTFRASTVPTELWDHFRLQRALRGDEYVLHATNVKLLIINESEYSAAVKSVNFNNQIYVIDDLKVASWFELASPYEKYGMSSNKNSNMMIWFFMLIGSTIFIECRMWRLLKFPKKGKPTPDNQAQ